MPEGRKLPGTSHARAGTRLVGWFAGAVTVAGMLVAACGGNGGSVVTEPSPAAVPSTIGTSPDVSSPTLSTTTATSTPGTTTEPSTRTLASVTGPPAEDEANPVATATTPSSTSTTAPSGTDPTSTTGTTRPATETVVTDTSSPTQADPNEPTLPSTTVVAEEPPVIFVPDDDVPDYDMIDVYTGTPVNLRSVVKGDKPLLFWFWSPL